VIFGFTVTLGQSDVYRLLDAIRAGGDIDIIRQGVELVLQALIDAEATERIGRSEGETFALQQTAPAHRARRAVV
jgi:hypothetical protein